MSLGRFSWPRPLIAGISAEPHMYNVGIYYSNTHLKIIKLKLLTMLRTNIDG